jgi:hypothetical protein
MNDVAVSTVHGEGPSGFGYGTTGEEMSLTATAMLVAGCNSGLRLETIFALTLRPGRFCRSPDRKSARGGEGAATQEVQLVDAC